MGGAVIQTDIESGLRSEIRLKRQREVLQKQNVSVLGAFALSDDWDPYARCPLVCHDRGQVASKP